jgi:predicted kinase
MPRLILLNGPPACGKSTVARRYVDEHPLALNLDVDQVRSMIGRWRDDPHAAGLLARAISLAAARTHLAAGHDVVVPQLLARLTFIEQLEALAREVGAVFHEVVLLDSKENMLRRFAERSPEESTEDLSTLYDRLMSLLATRPGVRTVQVTDGDVEATYRAVRSALGEVE